MKNEATPTSKINDDETRTMDWDDLGKGIIILGLIYTFIGLIFF